MDWRGINAHRGRGGKRGTPHLPPSKDWIIKMQSNTKIEDPFPGFLTTPSTHLKRM